MLSWTASTRISPAGRLSRYERPSGYPGPVGRGLCLHGSVSRTCPVTPALSNCRRSYSGRNSSFILSLCFRIDSSFVSGQFSSADDPNPFVAFCMSDHQKLAAS